VIPGLGHALRIDEIKEMFYGLEVDMGLRVPPPPPQPLPTDPFAREEAWIASGDGLTFSEFVERAPSRLPYRIESPQPIRRGFPASAYLELKK
jgi:hypothetical protein